MSLFIKKMYLPTKNLTSDISKGLYKSSLVLVFNYLELLQKRCSGTFWHFHYVVCYYFLQSRQQSKDLCRYYAIRVVLPSHSKKSYHTKGSISFICLIKLFSNYYKYLTLPSACLDVLACINLNQNFFYIIGICYTIL